MGKRSKNHQKLEAIFHRCIRHLVKQGQAAVDDDGNCVYYDRHTNHRCAIGGVLKKDDARHLQSKYGGFGLSNLTLSSPPKLCAEPNEKSKKVDAFVCKALGLRKIETNVIVLSSLQDAHDNYVHLFGDAFVDHILNCAEVLARQFDFSFDRDDYADSPS